MITMNAPDLQSWVLAHPQASHPHVGEEHLTAGVGYEVSVFGGHGQLQTCGIAPVFQFIGQKLHGQLLIVFVGLIQQLIGQRSKLPKANEHFNCACN